MPRREKMSAVDTAWLRMDRPTNLMMIVGVMVFAQRMDFKRLRGTLETRLVGRYRRFRQCAVQEVAGAFWEDDPDFDIDAHLKRRALPANAGKKELQALASELAVQPLNAGKPLWRFDLIEDYEGGSAIVVRIHHSIADGIALVGVILSLTDLAPHASDRARVAAPAEDSDADEAPVGLLETLSETLASTLSMGSELGGKALDPTFDAGLALAMGCVLYIATGMLLGIVFHVILTRYAAHAGLATRLAWASVIATAIWVVNFYLLLSWIQPWLFGGNWITSTDPVYHPWWVALATHLVFGWTMAVIYPWGLFHPYRPQVEEADET